MFDLYLDTDNEGRLVAKELTGTEEGLEELHPHRDSTEFDRVCGPCQKNSCAGCTDKPH